jgi:hypothetical protein
MEYERIIADWARSGKREPAESMARRAAQSAIHELQKKNETMRLEERIMTRRIANSVEVIDAHLSEIRGFLGVTKEDTTL